jgi:hypothetical protein
MVDGITRCTVANYTKLSMYQLSPTTWWEPSLERKEEVDSQSMREI